MAIKDWPGGTITDIPVEPSGNYQDSAASGVWTVDQVSNYVKQNLWPTPGNISPDKYVEGVFSTYLYTGNGSTQTITNGIDLAGEGGAVWIKKRFGGDLENHTITDTERGANKKLETNTTDAEFTDTNALTSFNSNGFSLGAEYEVNDPVGSFASWTFRKAEKFFDVVTYTGTGSAQTVAHNLGVAPACIIIKKIDSLTYNAGWAVYHQSLTNPDTYYLRLDTTAAETNYGADFISNPTSTTFDITGASGFLGLSGSSYVAYLFASDAGGFGDDGSESIIKCGSFTADGSGAASVNLGWEAQWILHKTSSTTGSWGITDNMRGMPATGSNTSQRLEPNSSLAEETRTTRYTNINSTGFNVDAPASSTSIYIAIRRPMKTPESGTEVYNVKTFTGTDATAVTNAAAGFPVDFAFEKQNYTSANNDYVTSRLTAGKSLAFSSNAAETSENQIWDSMTGVSLSDQGNSYPRVYWMFKRATGFFDVVAYTGDGVAGRTVAHNLGVAPEMIIIKRRESVRDWGTGFDSLGWTMRGPAINSTEQAYTTSLWWNNTAPTNTEFTLGTSATTNGSLGTYIAYLFATLAGVSKVGSYTGTGADLNVDCGFSAGARFILIKRTDSTGDWYVWDSARGIVAGNDPYLLLNSTAAEVTSTDYIDPLASGFTVTSSAPAALNASGGTYIFLAIA